MIKDGSGYKQQNIISKINQLMKKQIFSKHTTKLSLLKFTVKYTLNQIQRIITYSTDKFYITMTALKLVWDVWGKREEIYKTMNVLAHYVTS